MAVDLPAPEKPVITTKSCRRDSTATLSDLLAGRRSPPPRSGRRGLMTPIVLILPASPDARGRRRGCSPGTVQVAVQLACDLAGEAGHGLQLLTRGRRDRLGRAEVSQQRALAGRTNPRQLVQQRAVQRAAAARAVMRQCEAMRL